MKITHVETFIAGNPWKNWLFTRVHTDEGVYGIGEGTTNAFAKTIEAAIHELKPMYIGMDPFQLEAQSCTTPSRNAQQRKRVPGRLAEPGLASRCRSYGRNWLRMADHRRGGLAF